MSCTCESVQSANQPANRWSSRRSLLRTGRKRTTDLREVLNAIRYMVRSGCEWRMLPIHFPPWQTVYWWFRRFVRLLLFRTIHDIALMLDRERVGREASPSAAVLDSQSAKTAEAGGPRGYDAGKKVKGRKRHALVDTDGRALTLHVHPADIQDRDGAVPLLQASRGAFPFVERVFADSAYAGQRVANATRAAVEIVRKIDGQIGFQVHKRRWVVERFFAWIGRNRRLSRDVEKLIPSAEAFLYAASATILLRRLGRC